ncbi:tRNA (N6-threonylcarbamoyladenosine(37)-N6)-methyltransferase TrmO [Thalassotalea euphylliae]|uniref:tRNA (N6-threonylcarbamoyladenosine(37)-N6)-methyltransferase TrmO n=1 Tax=Thalassotalea euphylliae TaxID=1655234 RepID=UPI00363072A2
MQSKFTVSTLGIVHSPYKEKFAIPRQPGLVTAAKGFIDINCGQDGQDMVQGLEGFSHIWVLFMFHQTLPHGWKTKVKPPRLGGNKKIGVLATRSTFRPNGIGMSVVALENIELTTQGARLHISGLDLLDQTPVVDIKPYIGYSDSISHADSGFADEAPKNALTVLFEEKAELRAKAHAEPLFEMIQQVLTQDPRPAYRQGKPDEKTYGMRLFDVNVTFAFMSLTRVKVLAIE